MQREDTIGILKALNEVYGTNITELSMEIWYTALKEFDAEDVKRATFDCIRTEHFSPKPADIISRIVDSKAVRIDKPQELSAMQAWALVHKAICNSAYNSKAEYEKLPELVQKAVGSADVLRDYAIDSEFNASVVQSHFTRVYNSLIDRKEKEYQLKIDAIKRGDIPIMALNDGKYLLQSTNH